MGVDTFVSSRLIKRGRIVILLIYCLALLAKFAVSALFLPNFSDVTMMVRRSARLEQQQQQVSSDNHDPKPKRSKSKEQSSPSAKKQKRTPPPSPLRRRESQLKSDAYDAVIGIDEAGRGPLAGPVVAAAAIVPHFVEGVLDSKLFHTEEKREQVYQELISSPDIQWAVAVVDAARIDEINILQATLEAMRMAANGVIHPKRGGKVCVKRKGCYVVCSSPETNGKKRKQQQDATPVNYYALIDGNKVPDDMPCEAEAIVRGDSKEYSIAAASILAKVTRDRLMRGYHDIWPQFLLSQHKGYPTAAHMALVRKHGASPIHRRTFAPLKHMSFDNDGRILREDS